MAGGDLIGVIVGGVIGLAGSFVPHLWERRRARVSARALARAYISGILRMEEIRQHGSLYQKNMEALQSGATEQLMQIFGSEDDQSDELQKTLIGQVGLLKPDVARDLVIFGNMLKGLQIDLKAIKLKQLDNFSVAEKIRILKDDLKLWNDTLDLGRSLVRRLS
jgi:hypothetical protein